MLVCIRGCKKVGERCFDLLQYEKDTEICFADLDSSKKNCRGKSVYSVSESIDRYHKGMLDFFIISLEYSEKIRTEMIEELRLGDVKEEHILLFPNKPETEYKIKHLADLQYIKKLCFWNPHFERLYSHMDESDTRNICGKLKKKYHAKSFQIEITGGGYLRDYLDRELLQSVENKQSCSQDGFEQKVYVICDDSTYRWKTRFEKAGSSDIFIFLYEFLMHYYYKMPYWYFNYCKMQVSQNISSVATGISYIKCALQDCSILNLANTGQDLEHDFIMFEKYMEICSQREIKVENAIIGLCPYSLRYSMKQSHVNCQELLLYEPVVEGILLEEGYPYYSWWYAYQKKLIDIFLKDFDMRKCFFEYYVPMYGKVDNKEAVFCEHRLSNEERAEYQNIQHRIYNKPYEATIQKNKEILRKYTDSASNRGVKVIFFLPPYTELYKREWNRDYLEELKQYVMELRKEYEIHVLDLTEDYFPDWYFEDAGHLNAVGQRAVTKKVLEYVENIQRV